MEAAGNALGDAADPEGPSASSAGVGCCAAGAKCGRDCGRFRPAIFDLERAVRQTEPSPAAEEGETHRGHAAMIESSPIA